jgi:hypothetical protein
MGKDESKRDHIFISYATEDGDLAEWLAVRLTAEGYKVWCDRTHLLGGESYPGDIDRAIKDYSFRLVALLSRASLQKPNPRKERTLALNIARERKIDFLIPLNVAGLSATELDWMTSDLTFIPFQQDWAAGFAQLLKKLDSIEAPRDICAGRNRLCDWIAIQAKAVRRQETLRANLLPVLELPKVLHKFAIKERVIFPKLSEHWPFFHPTDSDFVWAFDPPHTDLGVPVQKLTSIAWQDIPDYDGLQTHDLSLSILRKAITVICLQRGMKLAPKAGFTFFPDGLLERNHLRFTTYDGRKSFVSAVGERTFRKGDQREKVKYHLAPIFRLTSTDFPELAVRVIIRLHLTDINGYPLEGSKVISRRKRICKNWWNHEWISRILAVVEWLGEGQKECEVLRTANGSFRIGGTLYTMFADQGIDESNLRPVIPSETDEIDIDEDIEEGGDEFDDLDEEAAEDV